MTAPLDTPRPHVPADVSVVIVTYNSAGEIEACLRSILDTPPRRRVEILVVDNGSTDDTLARVAALRVRGAHPFCSRRKECDAVPETVDAVVGRGNERITPRNDGIRIGRRKTDVSGITRIDEISGVLRFDDEPGCTVLHRFVGATASPGHRHVTIRRTRKPTTCTTTNGTA